VKIQTRGYARTAVAIMKNRIADDGMDGVSYFGTVHEPRGMIRAVRSLIRLGVFRRVDAARGELAVSPGTNWGEVAL
jgi:hypothetical protein